MTQSQRPTAQYPRDETYHWDSAVEGALFKIPKFHLIHGSEWFATTYGLLKHNQVDSDGDLVVVEPDSQLNQAFLKDVTAPDFRVFLQVLYPRTIQITLTLPRDQWVSVLRVSTLWFFKEIRQLAIGQLDKCELGPIELVSLGKQFHISRWLLTGYDQLVRCESPISLDAAKEIGMESAVRLYICRERRLHQTDSDYLKTNFGDELAALAEREKQHMTEAELAAAHLREESNSTGLDVLMDDDLDSPSLSQEEAIETALMLENELEKEKQEEARLEADARQREQDRQMEEALERERLESERERHLVQQAEQQMLLDQQEAKRKEAEARATALEKEVNRLLGDLALERSASSTMVSEHKKRAEKSQQSIERYVSERNQLAARNQALALKLAEAHAGLQNEREKYVEGMAGLQERLTQAEKYKRYAEMGTFFQSLSGEPGTRPTSSQRVVPAKTNPAARMSWNGHDTSAAFASVEATLAGMVPTGEDRPQKRVKFSSSMSSRKR